METSLKKRELLEALRAGQDVPGAFLTRGKPFVLIK